MPLSTLAVALASVGAKKSLPPVQLQFSTRVETTAHQLNATEDYPPYKRSFTVYIDFVGRRSRIDYEPAPHMPPKSFVRRYDLGFEWMATEVLGEKRCEKSKLREAMPMPRYPERLRFLGREKIQGVLCDRWRENHDTYAECFVPGGTRGRWEDCQQMTRTGQEQGTALQSLGEEVVDLFLTTEGNVPVRLTTTAVDLASPEQTLTPMLTYDFLDFEQKPPPEDAFRMKASTSSPIFEDNAPLTVDKCERVVQEMGFPYIHFLHTYYYT